MTPPKHGRRAATPSPARFRLRPSRGTFRPARAAQASPSGDIRTASTAAPRKNTVRPAFSILAMTFIGGMLVSTNVPALAITATEAEPHASVYAPVEDTIRHAPQHVEVAGEAEMKTLSAEGYAVEAAPPPIVSQVAGVGDVSVVESDLIVWPVVTWEKRASGFGPRSAPCGGCSTFHDGIDFNPGDGTPVMSIADGVVVLATENGGGLGVNVEVQHNIGGELITSSYAHMQYGSLAVSVGDSVTAGQQVGLVGSTGQSTGPHLHLEMFGVDGVRFDGFAWLSARIG
jgi:murein DD-endopeptidase MepM/ murein hydrolase activator NlpD